MCVKNPFGGREIEWVNWEGNCNWAIVKCVSVCVMAEVETLGILDDIESLVCDNLQVVNIYFFLFLILDLYHTPSILV